jgi:hypothetical protein
MPDRAMSEQLHHGVDMPTNVVEGGCFCGEVRYRITAAPTNSMVCHCQSCRRVAAAPVVAWVTFPVAHFELIRGRPSEFHSSEPVRRTFCATCGTPLTYEHRGNTQSLDVTTCSLDQPELFPPTHHSWLSHDLAWVRFGDGLPTFQEWRPSNA